MKNFRNDLVWNINECRYQMVSGDSTSTVWESYDDNDEIENEIMINHTYNGGDDVEVLFNGMVELTYETLEDALNNMEEIEDIFSN